jgi:hypothetical protein
VYTAVPWYRASVRAQVAWPHRTRLLILNSPLCISMLAKTKISVFFNEFSPVKVRANLFILYCVVFYV